MVYYWQTRRAPPPPDATRVYQPNALPPAGVPLTAQSPQ